MDLLENTYTSSNTNSDLDLDLFSDIQAQAQAPLPEQEDNTNPDLALFGANLYAHNKSKIEQTNIYSVDATEPSLSL